MFAFKWTVATTLAVFLPLGFGGESTYGGSICQDGLKCDSTATLGCNGAPICPQQKMCNQCAGSSTGSGTCRLIPDVCPFIGGIQCICLADGKGGTTACECK